MKRRRVAAFTGSGGRLPEKAPGNGHDNEEDVHQRGRRKEEGEFSEG